MTGTEREGGIVEALGKCRTAAGVIVGVKDAGGKPLRCQTIQAVRLRPDADTHSQYVQCIVGYNTVTREVVYLKTADGRMIASLPTADEDGTAGANEARPAPIHDEQFQDFVPAGMRNAHRWGVVKHDKQPYGAGGPEWRRDFEAAISLRNELSFKGRDAHPRVLGYCFGGVSNRSTEAASDPEHGNVTEKDATRQGKPVGALYMRPDPRYGCIDYDHVLNPVARELRTDLPEELAAEITTMTRVWPTEVSASGTGLHVIFEKREGWPHFTKIPREKGAALGREVFSGAGYVNFTGDRWKDQTRPNKEQEDAAYNLLLGIVNDYLCKNGKGAGPVLQPAAKVVDGVPQKTNSESAEKENAKNGFDDILALDSGNGLTNSAAELVVVDVEEPNVKALPPWKREIRINAEFEECGVARSFKKYRHTFDDEGNACRFEDECGDFLQFDKNSDDWIGWQVNHWEPAEEIVIQAARFVGKSVKNECGKWINAEKGKPEKGFEEHAARSASYRAQTAMLAMAKANMTVDLRKDSDPTLLACRNGIFDSKNGIFYPLTDCERFKTRYPTVYIDAEYTAGVRSEKWINHLETVMDDNSTEGLPKTERENRRDELVKYLLRLFGYGLYAGNPERIFVFFYGNGRNGKSTTMDVLFEILGEQAGRPSLTQLFSKKEDSAAPSIAAALPKRLANFTEVDGGAPMSASAIKEISGERKSERFRLMRQDNVEIPIYCLPIATTNDCPTFDKEVDYALLTRLVIIPFKHRFEGEDRTIQPELVAEKDKIFSMMIDECRKYLNEGLLAVPNCAKLTGEELMAGSDRYRFLTEVLEPTDGKGGENVMPRNDIAETYVDWAMQAGVDVGTQEKDGKRVLTKYERDKLFAAMRICGYAEATIKGKRGFRARDKRKRGVREQKGVEGWGADEGAEGCTYCAPCFRRIHGFFFENNAKLRFYS